MFCVISLLASLTQLFTSFSTTAAFQPSFHAQTRECSKWIIGKPTFLSHPCVRQSHSTNTCKSSNLHSSRNFFSLSLSLGKEWLNSGDSEDYNDDDDDESDIDLSDQDWRAFRAKLVMQPTSSSTTSEENTGGVDDDIMDLDGIGAALSQPETTKNMAGTDTQTEFKFSPLDPSQWAYDSGKVIEPGAVILGGVEQDFGFGLRQQYFHKTVILVLDHDENQFTKGIILNRPTDMLLVDEDEMDDDKQRQWRVWFGGDVQGWDSIMPDIVCLHSLQGKEVEAVSTQVMKDIQVSKVFSVSFCTFFYIL